MNAHSLQPGFLDYVAMAWSRRTLVAFIAVFLACLTFIGFNFAPKKYTAMCVFERRDNTISAQTSGLHESFNSLKSQLSMDITSKSAIMKALEDLGYMDNLHRDAAGRLSADDDARIERIVSETHRNLRVSWLKQTSSYDRLALRLTCTDPTLSSELPNRLVENYITFTREKILGALNNSATYLQQQIDIWSEKAADVRSRRYDFRMAHPNMMPDDPNHLAVQIEQANTDMEEMNLRSKSLQARLEMLQDMKAHENESRVANPEYNVLVDRLTRYERQIHSLTTEKMMLENHPRVKRLKTQIADTRAALKETPRHVTRIDVSEEEAQASSMLDVNIENVKADLATLQLRIDRKTAQVNQLATAQSNYLPIIQEYGSLTQDLIYAEAEQKKLYTQLGKIQRAIEAEQTGARTKIAITSLAKPPMTPSWPALWHIFVLGIGGGLSFAIMLVLIMTRMSRCFESAEEARNELGLPVLGIIGPIMTPATRKLRAIRKYVLIPATMALLLLVTILAAAGLVMSTNYPGRYARIIEHFAPITKAMWEGMQSLLGLM